MATRKVENKETDENKETENIGDSDSGRVSMVIYMKPHLKEEIKYISRCTGLSMSQIARDIFLHYLCGVKPNEEENRFGYIPADMLKIYDELYEQGMSTGIVDGFEYDVPKKEESPEVEKRLPPKAWDFDDIDVLLSRGESMEEKDVEEEEVEEEEPEKVVQLTPLKETPLKVFL